MRRFFFSTRQSRHGNRVPAPLFCAEPQDEHLPREPQHQGLICHRHGVLGQTRVIPQGDKNQAEFFKVFTDTQQELVGKRCRSYQLKERLLRGDGGTRSSSEWGQWLGHSPTRPCRGIAMRLRGERDGSSVHGEREEPSREQKLRFMEGFLVPLGLEGKPRKKAIRK